MILMPFTGLASHRIQPAIRRLEATCFMRYASCSAIDQFLSMLVDWVRKAIRIANDRVSASARYVVSARFRASPGYTWLRDRSGGNNDADQFGAACEYDRSKRVLLCASAAWLRNRGQAEFTLKAVNVGGLTPSWPGASV
ncbi:hypothetical protein [Paraburkholderia sacchari]|uniref:hypothetical protein n=1 Tax=Paraburkholderia sacchari TaxID=159450 RepID=UPI003D99B80F